MFFAAIYTWGYSRTSPVAVRVATRLLGGNQAGDDSKLALHARKPVVEKKVREAGPCTSFTPCMLGIGG
jgi:hypothetical protein